LALNQALGGTQAAELSIGSMPLKGIGWAIEVIACVYEVPSPVSQYGMPIMHWLSKIEVAICSL
jgi:hypothetical protein